MRITSRWLLFFCLLALSGCTQHYVITTNSGSQIGTQGKPRLKNGVYVFKDAMGRDSVIPAASITEISPASMSTDPNSKFNPGKE